MAAEGSTGEGNWFQRQKELKGWSQPAVETLHAFVLGGECLRFCTATTPMQCWHPFRSWRTGHHHLHGPVPPGGA